MRDRKEELVLAGSHRSLDVFARLHMRYVNSKVRQPANQLTGAMPSQLVYRDKIHKVTSTIVGSVESLI